MSMHTDSEGRMVVDGEVWPAGWSMYCGHPDAFSIAFSYENPFRTGECLLVWEGEAGWGFCVDGGGKRLHQSEPEFATGREAALAAEAMAPELLPAVVLAIANRGLRRPLTTDEARLCVVAGSGRCVKCGTETCRHLIENGKAVAYCGSCQRSVV